MLSALLGIAFLLIFYPVEAISRDNSQWNNSELHTWFDQLKSGKGACCSFADGVAIKDVDWDMRGGHYRVRMPELPDYQKDPNAPKKWFDVPDDSVISEPNKFGPAVVWPYWYENKTQIRCFLPGAES